MERDLEIMDEIQKQKEIDISKEELLPMDEEGRKLAEGKRFTIDIIDAPADPLR